MAKTVKILNSPNLLQQPDVVFRGDDFNALVQKKGLDVVIENAVKCPCKSKNNDYQSTCKNCMGVGWVYINSHQDRGILSSINSETQYKEWSEMKIGTVSVSLMSRSYLSYMDRITVKDSQVIQSQVLYPIVFEDNFFAYTIYDIDEIVEVFRFISTNDPLELLTLNEDYTFDRNKILITVTNVASLTLLRAVTGYTNGQKATISSNSTLYEFSSTSTLADDGDNVIKPDDILAEDSGRWLKVENYTISIRYKHKLQYLVLDNPHVIRNSYKKNSLGREELQHLPIHAIARLTHYIVDSLNFEGNNIFDNSYNI